MKESKKPYRSTVNKWKKIVDGYADSGLSVSAYCYKNGISDNSFYAWRKRLSLAADEKPKSFIQVSGPKIPAGKSLCIQTPGGFRLEIAEGVNGDLLKQVLRILAAAQ